MPDTSPKNTAAQQRGKGMQSTRQPEKAGAEHIETVRQTPVPSERLKQIFMVICGVFFLLLYAVLSVYNSAFSCFKAYIVLPLALVVICALYFLYRLLCRSTDFLERNLRALLFVLLGAAACISLGVGIFARFTPAYDLGAIYYGGYELAQTGSLGSYTEYFAMFSNNLGGLGIFTALSYICSLLGISDMYIPALLLGIFCTVFSAAAMFFAARRMFGTASAFTALIVFLLLPSFPTLGAAFYTDVLSMPFVAGGLLMYLKARESALAGALRSSLLRAALCGIILAAGTTVKGTAAICLIAVIIDCLLIGARRLRRAAAVLTAVPAFALTLALALPLLSGAVPAELAKANGIPWTHWVAMSAHGSGLYDPYDYEAAKARPDKQARKEADIEIIKKRYNENGIGGTLKLWSGKLMRDFGNGTFSASDFLDDSPAYDTAVQQTVLKEGRYYNIFANLCQGIYIGFMLLAAAGIIKGALCGQTKAFMPALCLFGLAVFLMFWEASARYVTNFLPVMLLCLAGSLYSLPVSKKARAKKQKAAKQA